MNKVLNIVFFVLFLALAVIALWLEIQLNEKRSTLTDRNRMQEDYLVKIAGTIEKAEPSKDASFEIKKDTSAVEARIVDSPDMENVLEGYQGSLEQANLDSYNWNGQREALRRVYALDAEGKPMMDGGQPQTRDSDEYKLLEALLTSAKNQQSRLNTSRSALADLRGKLEGVVAELNKIKPEARQDKVTIEEQKTKMTKLEEEKTALENQITKIKSQINELNGEITSLKDEVSTAKDETEAAKEETAKAQKLIDQLKKLLQDSIQTRGTESSGSGTAVTSLPAGDKGKVVEADNENMFAIVSFSDEAMKQLKGDDLSKPLPLMEFGVRRAGFNGPAGEFVGRLRLRQEVTGKNYVICDILGPWEQDKLQANDIIYAD